MQALRDIFSISICLCFVVFARIVAMAEQRQSSDDDEFRSIVDGNEEKNDLKEFILLYEMCPSLWNPKDKHYLNTIKKNEDLNKLVKIYKNMKPNATKDDVRKKINSLRSNYRKELKKIENSKRSGSGADEVYKATSSTFHLLKFLANIETPKLKKDTSSSEFVCEEDSLVISSITNERPPVKIRKASGTIVKQNELLNRACSLLSQPSVSPQQDVNPLALVWSDKLKSLNPTQKLYAEKAIHDILFEAQLNNLHRHSVQINNAFAAHSSPASSTCYPYTPSPVSHVPVNLISDSCETYTSPGTSITYPSVSHVPENLIPDSCETYTSPGTSITYPSVSHVPENFIPDSCETYTSPSTSKTYPSVSHVPENLIPDSCETYTSSGTSTTYPPVLNIPELNNISLVHTTAFTHGKPNKPSSTSTRIQRQKDGKVQTGPASQIILKLNSETSNSDKYTVGSLFAKFKPT